MSRRSENEHQGLYLLAAAVTAVVGAHFLFSKTSSNKPPLIFMKTKHDPKLIKSLSKRHGTIIATHKSYPTLLKILNEKHESLKTIWKKIAEDATMKEKDIINLAVTSERTALKAKVLLFFQEQTKQINQSMIDVEKIIKQPWFDQNEHLKGVSHLTGHMHMFDKIYRTFMTKEYLTATMKDLLEKLHNLIHEFTNDTSTILENYKQYFYTELFIEYTNFLKEGKEITKIDNTQFNLFKHCFITDSWMNAGINFYATADKADTMTRFFNNET